MSESTCPECGCIRIDGRCACSAINVQPTLEAEQDRADAERWRAFVALWDKAGGVSAFQGHPPETYVLCCPAAGIAHVSGPTPEAAIDAARGVVDGE